MMAIVGEPSADGLVMEEIELSHGPVGTALPGGLRLDVTLDGDVVGHCEVTALLRAGAPDRAGAAGPRNAPHPAPDLLAPAAWRVALAGAASRRRGRPQRREERTPR